MRHAVCTAVVFAWLRSIHKPRLAPPPWVDAPYGLWWMHPAPPDRSPPQFDDAPRKRSSSELPDDEEADDEEPPPPRKVTGRDGGAEKEKKRTSKLTFTCPHAACGKVRNDLRTGGAGG